MTRTFSLFLLVFTLLGTAASIFFWGINSGIYCAASSAILALGFVLTKGLIETFTGTQKNPLLIAVFFAGKLAWWVSLFLATKFVHSEDAGPVTVAMMIFLFSLLISGLSHYGISGISKESQNT